MVLAIVLALFQAPGGIVKFKKFAKLSVFPHVFLVCVGRRAKTALLSPPHRNPSHEETDQISKFEKHAKIIF